MAFDSGRGLRRANSTSSAISVSSPSNSFSTSPSLSTKLRLSRSNSYNNHESSYLILLKTATVILFLLQNGSDSFIDWIKSNYVEYVKSLLNLNYPLKFKDSVRSKLVSIINYSENPDELQKLRINIHKLRSDMSRPGLKRSNSIDNFELKVIDEKKENFDSEGLYSHQGYIQRSRSLDIPRYNPSKKLTNMSTLLEESNDTLASKSSNNLINISSNNSFKYSNNPFYNISNKINLNP